MANAAAAAEKGARFGALPWELVGEALLYLDPDTLRVAEACSRELRTIIARRHMWRRQFAHCVRTDDWRVPLAATPSCWKEYFHRCRRERRLSVDSKIPDSSATIMWKVSLPTDAEPFRKRSSEFAFSHDALGDPIKWQIEVELERALPVQPGHFHAHPDEPAGVLLHPSPTHPAPGSSVGTPVAAPLASIMGSGFGGQDTRSKEGGKAKGSGKVALPPKVLHRQIGLVRMWTTNTWTTDATSHYYGSHCTISIRDSLSRFDVQEEVNVDIDSSAALEFDTAYLDPCRELLIRVNLTLALELSAPLRPFYDLISLANTDDSDTVKIGYCKAVFEVARCKRKCGGMFVKKDDRAVAALVELAADNATSLTLRIEVFQALFNLLGPTSMLLDDALVTQILSACFTCLKRVPIPFDHHAAAVGQSAALAAQDAQLAGLLAQNALGTVFNLLVHPLCGTMCSASNLYTVARLLQDGTYRICHFSVITVLLTVLSWRKLPPQLMQMLEVATIAFMTENNPLDSDCTGVSWDESDVAAFFIPLLRSKPLICVMFATWCIAKYYFPHSPLQIMH